MPAKRRNPRAARTRWWLLAAIPLTIGPAGGCTLVPTNANSNDNSSADGAFAVAADDHVRGDPRAAVVVIEYADLQCSVCGRFAREVFPTIETEYIDSGRIAWVTRHFPIVSIHPDAERAGRAAECAGEQDRFDAFVDLVFSDQTDLSDAGLSSRAETLDLDAPAFGACLQSPAVAVRVADDLAQGIELGVSATPTFFINGDVVVGFRGVAEFRALLDAALN